MTPCDYQILQYTNSELRTDGVPFVVILRIHVVDSSILTAYVVKNWESTVKIGHKGELDDIEAFLEDLRQQSHASPVSDTRFFDRLNSLGVGPIRAFVSGSCAVQQLDTVIPMFFVGIADPSLWQRSFDIVGEDLFDSTGNLAAAYSRDSLHSDL
jgi:hypothetical protein